VAQATVGVLSEKMPMCLCSRLAGAICSSTSHCRSTPAISRSLFVMSPFGLECETNLLSTSGGKGILQTVGGMCSVPLIQTPPAPKPLASTYPRKAGGPGWSSRTDVGLDAILLRMIIQSWSACLSDGEMAIGSGSPFIAL
jgi:hypothetical protein